MPLQLRRAELADVNQLTDVFFSGFRKDAVMARCFPEKPSVRQCWIDGLKRDLADPAVHLVAVVDTDLEGSPIIAYANWVAPRTATATAAAAATTDQGQQNPPMYPEDGDDLALAAFFFPHLKGHRERKMAGRTCWYLAALVCHEEHQGRGAGGILMRYGVGAADAMQADIYVEASPPDVPVYKKFGFRDIGRVVVLDGMFTELFMLREYNEGSS
ncbi:acyl-CoA N-acyltransferase [Aspergillus keveii]|uniref:Acyl-CoA N-acyltransferase n=1 Tax=Aspergillus keveii TaxID=714993 RepID=A0ABR4FV32_9EURO